MHISVPHVHIYFTHVYEMKGLEASAEVAALRQVLLVEFDIRISYRIRMEGDKT